MRTLLTLVVGLFVLGPRPVAASEIRFDSIFHGVITFGVNPAAASDSFLGVLKDGRPFQSPDVSFFRGEFMLTSGPLLDLSVTNDAFGMPVSSVYQYGPGELIVNARWDSNTGPMSGTFVAPILGLTVNVDETNCFPFGCNKMGRATALLGPGLFDPLFADALDLDGPSVGGRFFAQAIDRITGTPSSEGRSVRLRGTCQAAVETPVLESARAGMRPWHGRGAERLSVSGARFLLERSRGIGDR